MNVVRRMVMRRREFLGYSGGLLLVSPAIQLLRRQPTGGAGDPARALGIIERRVHGRLGVVAVDTTTGRRIAHRPTERFPMCSTFKCLLAALVLTRVDRGQERLDRVISYRRADMLEWAPITRQHAAQGGMTVAALIAAALEYSDNTAANLLLRTVGGPHGWTAFARRIGDRVSRLDRVEPALNESKPGDPRDTTTPEAMVADLRRVLLGHVLTSTSRARLTSWLEEDKVGNDRLRAGVPANWRVGDKTGTGDHGSTNDVGILWPPKRGPILVAAYLTETSAPASVRSAALASVGQVVADWTLH